MDDITTANITVLTLFIIGTFLWASSPLFERVAGDRGALGALGGGVVFLVSAAVIGLLFDRASPISFLPVALIGWGALVYAYFRLAIEKKPSEFSGPVHHCVSKLIYGSPWDYEFRKWKIRTRLFARYSIAPSDSALEVSAWASGRAFYGLYFSRSTFELKSSLDVICTEDSSSCRITAQMRGQSEYSESPLAIRVDHVTTPSSSDLTVRTSITAGVVASGGSLGVSVGVGGSVGMPNASLSTKQEMGTFLWRCSPVPVVSPPSVVQGSTIPTGSDAGTVG